LAVGRENGSMTKTTEPTFEENMAALESLVKRLEAPDTPLETVIASFAEGQKLLKACQKRLQDAELILEKVNADGTREKI